MKVENNSRVVEPFNDIYTHDCFMNTLLCAADYYHLDYPILTLHKGFYYSFDGEQLGGNSVVLFPIDEMAMSIGLKINKEKDEIENWREQYKIKFEQDDIIIAPVDDYFNPLRVDIYQKEHLPHYILIYDMDNMNQTLSVIESRYRDAVSYKNMKIRYDDFEKSHFRTENFYKYVYKKINRDINFSYEKDYLYNCIKLTEQSVFNLQNCFHYLSENEAVYDKGWLNNINNICNQVKIERYVFKKVFHNSDLFSVVNEIYQAWYLLRTKIVKLSMKSQANDTPSKNITYLKKIEKLERDKLNILRLSYN